MIPKSCKRLAEVDFPIAVVSAHSAREKSIRHGHPSTLHLWWARRPLAACRAMLLALLLPDPCDANCPAEFKEAARGLLGRVYRQATEAGDKALRHSLLRFIGDFANWDNSAKPAYLEVGRGLVKAAHGAEPPLVVDPFAGGGSIPLEALRLGCDAFASDLNPVACLILKVMLEDIPRHGPELADELRKVGAEIKKQAEKELSQYYPPDPDGARPIAYLWARTVLCERCGAEIPLLRTTWLAKRHNKIKKRYTKLISLGVRGNTKTKAVTLSIDRHDVPTATLPEIPSPTIANGIATCRCCPGVLSAARVRSQLIRQKGGADVVIDESGNRISGARLMAVAHRAADGLAYRLPTRRDYLAVRSAQSRTTALSDQLPFESLSPLRPSPNSRGVSGATRIGITDFGRVFTMRQKLALHVLSTIARDVESAAKRAVSLAVSKLAERSTCFVTWINSTEAPRGTFARQALTIAWDFIELVPIVGDEEFSELIDAMVEVAAQIASCCPRGGQVEQAVANEPQLPKESAQVWFTDPPYYDSVPYADLSDLFYVWLKRILQPRSLNRFADESDGWLTPKTPESTWDEAHRVDGKPKDRQFFERSLAGAFAVGRATLVDSGIGCVVFAHKSTEGWEALLSGILEAGWVIVASWPVATERTARLNAKQAAALATSVHLVCRPRPEDAGVGDWSDVLRELPNRIGDWMERLSSEGVRGADLVFACIGPAMEIYSRYSKVEDAEGREIPLGGDPEASEPHKRGFLAYVWEIVGRTALQQVLGTAEARARNGAAGALEEDARLTALFLWTHQSTSSNGASNGAAVESAEDEDAEATDEDDDEAPSGTGRKGLTLIYDVVRRFSQPLGIHLDTWNGRIIETRKGIVRLLPVKERAERLLGEDGASGVADVIERSRGGPMNYQFGFMNKAEERPAKTNGKGRKRGKSTPDEAPTVAPGTTTLDRVHIAMLLQASGKANALRAMLKAEQERGPDFLRLANALSALYPRDSEEKRLLDAMLLAVPR